MIHVVLGTKAQLVKMAPVMVRMKERGVPYHFVHTGQHRATMSEMLEEFGLKPPDVVLYSGRDIVSLPQMAIWLVRLLVKCVVSRGSIFGADRRGIVLVHGDTFSTLLGALLGRVAGLRVGHVESGLRSFDVLHPFPEEITRLLTFRLSHVLYCPGQWAVDNVAGYRREKVDTGVNTLADTVLLARGVSLREDHVPAHPYAVVSLHRYENIFRPGRLTVLVEVLEEIAKAKPCLFILHPPTEKQLRRTGLYERLDANPRIELRPRYTYFDFFALLQRADFVVTDGGSIQEESSYLGLPCLLLRRATEREEGLGANVVLSHYDRQVIRDFTLDFEAHRQQPSEARKRPSDVIVDSAVEIDGGAGDARA
jgi:UDP-N-acetylglucosamine 2-epimerase (non-hydrolysing)